eukprot:CAMPEP_0113526876 /NCGR_PEP_ID=MMETSP0015_2-20120614/985_1 /TAXON_ID=2838 /ORGANISM="Odontella" /LENGTH=82 /DNA_ID=CAMNT_0000425251 /DNA_START=317 /DNA_END=565 /DNA_ORIENTATION=+ /assembly_acc=CAM_ASM_000160
MAIRANPGVAGSVQYCLSLFLPGGNGYMKALDRGRGTSCLAFRFDAANRRSRRRRRGVGWCSQERQSNEYGVRFLEKDLQIS